MKISLKASETSIGMFDPEKLDQYFSGKSVRVIQRGNKHIEIELTWPSDISYYIDPLLTTGLKWWSSQMTVQNIPYAVKQKNRYQLSLNDNWTLYSWSKWLQRRMNSKGLPHHLIILHVDDHSDCMSPLLFRNDGAGIYTDPLTQKNVDLLCPESVKHSIESGAITIGSFMTPFLHYFPNIEVRHLLPTHRLNRLDVKCSISKLFQADDFFGEPFLRPALKFEREDTHEILYNATNNIETFLKNIPIDATVLLHVDMDYFNNRFDGDSDWQYHQFSHDPLEKDVMANVSNLFKTLLKTIPTSQLEDITIALSPSFFPAEFWEKSLAIIDELC